MVKRSDLKQLSACRRKIRYPSRKTALRAALEFGRKVNDFTMSAYFCKWCKNFHIGH